MYTGMINITDGKMRCLDFSVRLKVQKNDFMADFHKDVDPWLPLLL